MSDSTTFKLHTLGCGSAKPNWHHNTSSTVLNIRETLYMIDCGEGTQLQMMKQHLKFARLNHIFLTHLHGDHVFGLPGLMGTLSLQNVGGHVTIHTFEEGKQILSTIFDYFSRDTTFDIEFNVIEPTEAVILDTPSLTVRTIPLDHRLPDVGFVFEEKPKLRHINREMVDFHGVPIAYAGRLRAGEDFVKPDGTVIPNRVLTTDPSPSVSYAHMSDTAYKPDIAEKIGPVDLLLHETTYLSDNEAKARVRGHSTAAQAAQIAKAAGARWLLTGHYSSSVKEDRLFLEEAQSIFPNTILNNEGLIIDLNKL